MRFHEILSVADRVFLLTESNPFARKAGADLGKNPFSRNAEMNKSLHKTESFFNKVEAAEVDKSKRACRHA